MFAHAALAPAGSDGALFLPTLSGIDGAALERPHARRRSRAWGCHHDRAHLARAILEGCAFALRDIVDRFAAMGLGGDEIRVVGGGARSALWLQIKADVTGRPVRAVRGENATGAGAAMLAGVAAGLFADLGEAAAQTVSWPTSRYCRGRTQLEVYDDAYRSYRRLFDGVEQALS